MTRFSLLILAAPGSPSNLRALCFAQTLIAQGHAIHRLFFYGEAVYTALHSRITPQGEFDVGDNWQTFIQEHQLDSVVCIAAALRRGVLDDTEAKRYHKHAGALRRGFELSGLGQLIESSVEADRSVTFK